MSIFNTWINRQEEINNLRTFLICTEVAGTRLQIAEDLQEIIRSHYNDLAVIADDIKQLGYEVASKILKARLPQTSRARSGDLGEILATEYIEYELGYDVPIRRLRYKDGREMALRGDDFIGIRRDKKKGLLLLKGESKSASKLSNTTIKNARSALDRDNGRCTPHALLFVADRLMEGSASGSQLELGRLIKTEVASQSLPPSRIEHAFFTMTANNPLASLRADLNAADGTRRQTTINLNIVDHQDFIAESYNNLEDLGND
jgi:hypothetical protein